MLDCEFIPVLLLGPVRATEQVQEPGGPGLPLQSIRLAGAWRQQVDQGIRRSQGLQGTAICQG